MSRAIRLLLIVIIASISAGRGTYASHDEVLPFIEDDFAAALKEARAKNLPIFAEAWAPWCHSCRSMKAYVFTDRTLAPLADRFVWLSIDTEKAVNAPFRKRYTIEGVPTFFVIDPKDESVALRWLGGANVHELVKILGDGERAFLGKSTGPEGLLARADKLYGEGKNTESAAVYEEALSTAPKDWSRRDRVTESLVFALNMAHEYGRCVAAASEAYPRVKDKPAAANVAALGLDCAVGLDEGDPSRDALIASFETASHEVLANPRVVVADDDRSGIYIGLIGAREAMGDDQGARRLVNTWSEFLERAAFEAKTPAQRVVFDSHRVSGYLELGAPECAVPMLQSSARDFPDDYNPYARLALAYEAMKSWDKALEASDRAMALSYGPRKLTILRTRSSIYRGMGNDRAAVKTIEEAVALASALPEGQRSERTIEAFQKQLALLKQASAENASAARP